MHAIADPPVSRHRISVTDYYRMGDVGILHEDDRVELIEGDIIDMTPIGSAHASVVMRLAKLCIAAVGDSAIVSVQYPIRLDAYSEPQPDLALLRPRQDYYRAAHPEPGDVLLVVEVADTGLAYDRGTKVPLYARHGIPEVWVLDLRGRLMHSYRQSRQDGYELVETVAQAGSVAFAGLGGVVLDLSGLF